MSKVIAIANQKGGVAKTTTAAALAAGLHKKGFKVLAIDIDAQCNLSDSVGVESVKGKTAYEMMKGEVAAQSVIIHTENFDIIPASLDLASADMEFTTTGREYRLKKAIKDIMPLYDFVILDTPPALGIMTVNAFIASDEIIIPAAGIDGAKGIISLFNTIEVVREFGNADLVIAGILLTMYKPNTIINQNIKELVENIGQKINVKVFDTYIRSSVMVDEAKANRLDIFTYNNNNNVSKDYLSFIDEYLN